MRKQVLVTVDRGETRVAMLEAEGDVSPVKSRRGRARKAGNAGPPAGYGVAEIYFERRGQRSIVGNIYKGKVDNVIPGLEAAFVDIGLDKNGFLHVDEVVVPGVDPVKRGRGGGGPRIDELLQPGQEIVVQVVKDPLKTKGARLSMELTIAGRYMVYAPTGEGVGVSRRLEDKERDRLRKEAKQLELGGGGAIIRTAAQGATREDFERELQYLFKLNEVLHKRVEETSAPALVFQEADLSVRVVRDIFSAHFERAIVDDPKQHHRLVSFFSRTAPELVDRVELWEDDTPLFEAYGVDPVIERMLSRRVDLPSGGYLVIDYAEALTVVDVNTGSFTGKGKQARLEDTITKTNLEAAEEVVRQLRLRDIGGIIVIDFIDMARSRNREAVLKTLRKALDEDRTKTFVVEISPLGLVEMTRQNVTDGVREIMTRPCPTCDGEGVVKSEETVAIEFERRLRRIAQEADGQGEAYLVRVNPKVSAYFTADGARVLEELETDTGRFFHFEGSEGLPLDYFAITRRGTRDEIMEEAVPFRAGEEVLVNIVEPHMYNADDAVAKIDSYLIDVVNGICFVGQKKLVLIEEAGRTTARAVLTGDDVEEAEKARAERAEATLRARRSRGRRGAQAPAESATAGAADDVAPELGNTADGASGSAESNEGLPAGAADGVSADQFARQPLGEQVVPDAAVAEQVDGSGASALEMPDRLHGDALAEALPDGADSSEEDVDDDAGEGQADAVESRPRRRGRRGGRRRSRAKAVADDATEVSEPSE
ncbi:MAG: Rne/Rng family ribonuclease [Actinomycetota bacterium]|nr:Rne/Rng family ribonuclease [Actinomycetota bacterium]